MEQHTDQQRAKLAEMREVTARGLIPAIHVRTKQWDATDYLIAADYLEDKEYLLASQYMRMIGLLRQRVGLP